MCASARRRLRAGARVADGLRLRRLLRLRRAHRRRAATCASASTARSSSAATRIAEVSPCLSFCGIELEHPVINASGTFDAIAARRVYGDALLEDFPFSAFVSKTITPGAAGRQRAAADLGDAGRDDQLDRAAEQGPRRASWPRTCRSWPSCRCR